MEESYSSGQLCFPVLPRNRRVEGADSSESVFVQVVVDTTTELLLPGFELEGFSSALAFGEGQVGLYEAFGFTWLV